MGKEQMEKRDARVAAAYEALAEACRTFGHAAEIGYEDEFGRTTRAPHAIVVDGTAVAVRFYMELESDRWTSRETGRLRVKYHFCGEAKTRPEAKAGFLFDVIAADVIVEAAYQAKARAAAVERKARADANQAVAWAIDEQLGAEDNTCDVARAMGDRIWNGPHVDVDHEGHLAFVLPGPHGRAFMRCSPDEAREILAVALRISRREKA